MISRRLQISLPEKDSRQSLCWRVNAGPVMGGPSEQAEGWRRTVASGQQSVLVISVGWDREKRPRRWAMVDGDSAAAEASGPVGCGCPEDEPWWATGPALPAFAYIGLCLPYPATCVTVGVVACVALSQGSQAPFAPASSAHLSGSRPGASGTFREAVPCSSPVGTELSAECASVGAVGPPTTSPGGKLTC